MIRYYGIYSRKHKFYDKMIMMFSAQQLKVQMMWNRWQLSIMSDFNYDPLLCPHCNSKMELIEHHFP